MNKSNPASDALQKLDWIAKLSKDACPPGVPENPEAVRELLNRIVSDVRGVCRLLSDLSDRSDVSDKKREDGPGLIPTHGGYRNLKSFQVAEILYDGTVLFCNRWVDKRSRTHDQMVQSGRSGRQNIAEGSMASATSKKTELKLTNVAKASQEELLLDLEDFLRHRRLRRWDKNDPEALAVRNRYKEFPAHWFENVDVSDESDLSDLSDESKRLDPYGIADATPEVAANTLLCLANQGTYLLKRQIARLERDLVEEGGFTERIYRVRTERRRQQRRDQTH
jgi:four helix bundle suffix protein